RAAKRTSEIRGLAERRRGQRQPDSSRILIHCTELPRRRPSHHGGLRRVRVWALGAVISGYFATVLGGAIGIRVPARIAYAGDWMPHRLKIVDGGAEQCDRPFHGSACEELL
ncbi:hypothetical protein, partial [Paractinoplanes ferrugineus]|uniref:hypothetical protein n=1 Tax=Paractinoplanes ferrugineus TaxID=113564 RepID=UPI0019440618